MSDLLPPQAVEIAGLGEGERPVVKLVYSLDEVDERLEAWLQAQLATVVGES